MPRALTAAHADWSAHPGKRWVTVARRDTAGIWRAAAPEPVGDPAVRLAALLASGDPLAFGLDLPLGVPRAFALGRPEFDFPSFLRGLDDSPEFFLVNVGLETVSPARPFYPQRGVRGMTRAGHAKALGFAGAAGLSRLCDRATSERPAGAPLFWTLGANQSGKAAIAAWRDWLLPALRDELPIAIWPFAGPLLPLLSPGRAVLAEVYPAEALRQCGLRLAGSKRSAAVRRQLAPALRCALAARGVVPQPALAATIDHGFGEDAAGEDRFDSLVGLLGLIGVLDEARPDFVPDDPWVRRWEGWVLGQTAVPSQAMHYR